MTVAARVKAVRDARDRSRQERVRDLATILMRDGRGSLALHDLGVGQSAFWNLVAKYERSRKSA